MGLPVPEHNHWVIVGVRMGGGIRKSVKKSTPAHKEPKRDISISSVPVDLSPHGVDVVFVTGSKTTNPAET